jgi:hypothetical protein
VILDGRGGHLRAAHFPLLSRALERHMCWAFEHALVGEDDAAASVLRDVHAIASEITESDDSTELSR